jgi:hypothetical protein
MSENISRREFIRNTSLAAAAGIGVSSLGPLSVVQAESTSEKVRVVIAKDDACMSGGKIVAAKVQEMLDAAVMKLTGVSSKPQAYAALFPAPITATTKIVCKRNDVSGRSSTSNATLVDTCLVAGLRTIPGITAANVTVQNSSSGTGSSSVTITAGGKTFPMRQNLVDAAYIINCPVAWMHGSDYGVTLSLKNTMAYISSPASFHSLNKSWLYECSLSPGVKPRQVLSLMDAIVGNNRSGPGGSVTFTAGTIILSKDIVAVDYNTLRLMEKQTSPNANQIKTGDTQLKSAATAGLGTNDPLKMEVINAVPPWGTGLINDAEAVMKDLDIQAHAKPEKLELVIPQASERDVAVVVTDARGRIIWATRRVYGNVVYWNHIDMTGARVADGMYIYSIHVGSKNMKGTVMVTN